MTSAPNLPLRRRNIRRLIVLLAERCERELRTADISKLDGFDNLYSRDRAAEAAETAAFWAQKLATVQHQLDAVTA